MGEDSLKLSQKVGPHYQKIEQDHQSMILQAPKNSGTTTHGKHVKTGPTINNQQSTLG